MDPKILEILDKESVVGRKLENLLLEDAQKPDNVNTTKTHNGNVTSTTTSATANPQLPRCKLIAHHITHYIDVHFSSKSII